MKNVLSALAAVLLSICVSARADDYRTVQGTYHYGFAQNVLEDVNLDRTGRGIPALVMTPELVDAAMKRAAELAVSYSHARPNGSRFHTAVPWVGCAGENIAYGQDEPWLVMEAWMESPGHRANILDPKYKSIGVGCFEFDETFYWVQVFNGGTGTGNQDSRNGDRHVTVDVGVVSGRDSVVRDYAIAFNANGGKGKMAAQTFKYGTPQKLKANKFKRAGYKFKGWAKSKALAKKGKVAYKNKKSVKNLTATGKTVKLYAVWKKK